jgi:hypothetical protein
VPEPPQDEGPKVELPPVEVEVEVPKVLPKVEVNLSEVEVKLPRLRLP